MNVTELISNNASCPVRKKATFLLSSLIPTAAILLNSVVLHAVVKDRRQLIRQSRVYVHVNSTLLANILFAVLALFQIFSLYFNFEGHAGDFHIEQLGVVNPAVANWWAFRKAFLCGIYLIMCGNIGLLIEAICTNTCQTIYAGVGKHTQGNSKSSWRDKIHSKFHSSQSSTQPKSRLELRRQSYFSLVILWIIPIAYIAFPAAGWSCAHICTCLSECYPTNGHIESTECSRGFPPMANSWLSVTIALWAVGLLMLILLLFRSVLVLREAAEFYYRSAKQEGDAKLKLSDETSNAAETQTDLKIPSVPSEENVHTKHGLRRFIPKQKKSLSSSRMLQVSSNLRYVIMMTISFGVCTAPTMAYLTVDMILPDMNITMLIINICLLSPFLYCYICPLLLIKCLPGVESALHHLMLSLFVRTTVK